MQTYLKPYIDAASRHGDQFPSLLWASPRTQAARFDAMARLYAMHGRRVIDAGCGRADFLDFLVARGMEPSFYIGIEAVDELAASAIRKNLPNSQIIHADFVREPKHLEDGADVIVFSGSLNTLDAQQFQATLDVAWESAKEALVFNFLSAAHLANAKWLNWHRTSHVFAMARRWSSDVRVLEDYLDGDCTIGVYKAHRIAS
jgi:SAM-dependent methyltransferase